MPYPRTHRANIRNYQEGFPCLAIGLRTDPGRACQYVVACVVLHNVGILRQDIVTLSLDDLTIAGPDIQEIGDPQQRLWLP